MQHIGTKSDTTFTIDPLEYRLRSYEDHLVIRVYNPTDDPIQLLGPQSTVVDPHSQSHALHGATIESHSFVKLILPPPLYAAPYGPEFGFAAGAGHRSLRQRSATILASDHGGQARTSGTRNADFHGDHRRVFVGGGFWYDPWYYDPWYYEPHYYLFYDANDQMYWDLRGETSIRLVLTFQRKDQTFREEFEFKRMKVQG